jgi:spore germination cell wall hydrolase CwlJ-like protein
VPVVVPKNTAELRQIECSAAMVYGEARGETVEGKIAVAYSAINRARKKTVCQVVLAPKQYSIFNGNPTLRAAALSLDVAPPMKNSIDQLSWKESLKVARKVIRRQVPDPTQGATHYLAPVAMEKLGLPYPRWSRQYRQVAVIDNHVFYKPYYPKNGKV